MEPKILGGIVLILSMTAFCIAAFIGGGPVMGFVVIGLCLLFTAISLCS